MASNYELFQTDGRIERATPQATRLAARAQIQAYAGSQRATVLSALKAAPAGLTTEELCEVSGLDANSARPRLLELRNAGAVVASGRVRKTESGRDAVVWVAA